MADSPAPVPQDGHTSHRGESLVADEKHKEGDGSIQQQHRDDCPPSFDEKGLTKTISGDIQQEEKGVGGGDDAAVVAKREDGEEDSDADSANGLERWDNPSINKYRFAVTNYSLFIMGANDSCIGALIPYIEPYYSLDYTTVSTLFIVPFIGYLIAGLTNNYIHHTAGQRGVAFLGPVCRLVGYIAMALHPPFPVLPVLMLVTGFGNGIEDSAYNAWIGNMHRANELLGLLHGSYGLGGTVSPLVASAMVTKADLPWYTYYYVMIGFACVEFVVGMTAFWEATGAAYRARISRVENGSGTTSSQDEETVVDGIGADGVVVSGGDDQDKHSSTNIRTVLKEPITWLVAVFLLAYVGSEVSLGGWIPTFMLKVRHAEPFLAGLTVTLFWLGLTIGRVLLGFITGRIGEKLAITGYLLCAVTLQLLYWLVPSFVASVVFVILLGFFLGPLFPAAIVAATKLLPSHYHVSAIGFAAAVGGGGAAIWPFAVGAIAQKSGVIVLQPIIVSLLSFLIVVWLALPGGMRKGGLERARDNKEGLGEDFKRTWAWVKRRGKKTTTT